MDFLSQVLLKTGSIMSPPISIYCKDVIHDRKYLFFFLN